MPADNSLRMQGRIRRKWNILKTRVWPHHGFYNMHETKLLIKFLDNLRPDIIHLHNIHNSYINVKMLFSYIKQHHISVVWTLHDCWSYTGHCAYYSAASCNKWKTACYSCPQLLSYPRSWLLDNSKRNYNMKKELFTMPKNISLVTVSSWLKKEVKKSFLNEKPCYTIMNGVDLEVFKPMNFKLLQTDKFILLGVASTWSKRKGLKDFIELSKYLTEDELIVLVGLNTSQIKDLPSNIIGLERTESQNELAALYSQSGVVLSLSEEETFGMTIIEGYACGTPAIVYNSTATPELIMVNTGMIVEPGDFSGIRDAIDIIKTSSIDYKNICRNYAVMHFNKDVCYEGYIKLYKKLLAKRHGF